ncbi:hypothetical protein MGH68_15435 [Erysipelothrix sp. D19-032]
MTVASYVAQTEFSAMIVGVATLEDARKKGYATQVVKKLSDDLYAVGNKACSSTITPTPLEFMRKWDMRL